MQEEARLHKKLQEKTYSSWPEGFLNFFNTRTSIDQKVAGTK